ncbi:MAG TPA: prepilin-type N-terminal cleavage/methylation domain-containing protein, partial [Opitutales bacterium]|nr:prepilin-type N-terminal cleavage/methylation domain-containing protein [Opitutales bacterium]
MRPPKSHFPSSTLPASPSSSGGRPRTGFTLIELLLSTVLGGIVIGAAVFIFANMAGSFSERDSDVDFPWTTSHAKVPQAPAYSQMESALNLQMAIMDLLQASNGGLTQSASAVFVVGGRDEAAPGGGCLNDFPDPLAAPVLSTAIGGAEAELMTSPTAFRTHITTAPDVTLSTEAIEDSFSIYIMNTPATIGAAIHCRRIDTANGMTVYSVYFYNSQG